jgi:hypothetical protein
MSNRFEKRVLADRGKYILSLEKLFFFAARCVVMYSDMSFPLRKMSNHMRDSDTSGRVRRNREMFNDCIHARTREQKIYVKAAT